MSGANGSAVLLRRFAVRIERDCDEEHGGCCHSVRRRRGLVRRIPIREGGPPVQAESTSVVVLALPLVFAASLVIGGVVMWVLSGTGTPSQKGSAVRHRIWGPRLRDHLHGARSTS